MGDEIGNEIESSAEDLSCENKTGDNDNEACALDQTQESTINDSEVTQVNGDEEKVENTESEKLDENESVVEGNQDIVEKENDGENDVNEKNGDDVNKNLAGNLTPEESDACNEKDEIEEQEPTRNDDITKNVEEKED